MTPGVMFISFYPAYPITCRINFTIVTSHWLPHGTNEHKVQLGQSNAHVITSVRFLRRITLILLLFLFNWTNERAQQTQCQVSELVAKQLSSSILMNRSSNGVAVWRDSCAHAVAACRITIVRVRLEYSECAVLASLLVQFYNRVY